MTARRKIVPLPLLEALFVLDTCPPNGYVHARFKKFIRSKAIFGHSTLCYYHFACFLLRYYSNHAAFETRRKLFPGGPDAMMEAQWDGRTPRTLLAEIAANMLNTGQLQIISVEGYSDALQRECPYCTQTRRTEHIRRLGGPVLYHNGPLP